MSIISRKIINDKRANSPRKHNNFECVCIEQQSAKIGEAKLIELQGEINASTIIVRNFKPPY